VIFLSLITRQEAFIELTIQAGAGKMSTRPRKQIIRSNEDALAAFISRKADIETMLGRLQGLSADHFGYAPDEMTWAHVGTLEHYAGLLQRVTDMAFNEGDHAA
jgi:hypothetical protein